MRFFGQVRAVDSLGIGVFDGVHLGHRQIVDQTDALLTLFPHPDRVLNKAAKIPYLTSPLEMAALCHHLIIGRFSRQTAQLSPESFIESVLREIQPNQLVVGEDFRFGLRQSGSADWLVARAKHYGVSVQIQTLVEMDGIPVKSTDIRRHIQAGQLDTAIQKLGHFYPLFGRVVSGEGRAQRLGFPTANLRVYRHKCLPPFGVYSGQIELDGERYLCLIYIGDRPTMGLGTVIEVHVHNFSGDLYGRRVQPWITGFIRPQLKFDSLLSLTQQLRVDLDQLLSQGFLPTPIFKP